MWLRNLFLLTVLTANVHALPDINSWTTSKGMKVLHVEASELPMVDIAVTLDAGSVRDGQHHGLARLTHSLLNKGAGELDADAIASRFEDVGAQFSASADLDRSSIVLRSLSDQALFSKALQLYIKVLAEPSFPAKDFERQRKLMLVGLEDKQQTPAAIVSDAFFKALYEQHPFAHSADGEIDTINALKLVHVERFHAQHFVAANAVLAIVGNVTQQQARAIAQQINDALPKGQAQKPIAAVTPSQQQQLQIDFPSQQAHVRIGQTGIQRGHPDYYSLYVGNHVLGGGGFTSRLVQEVRSKRGLSYSVYSYFLPYAQPGPFMLGLQTRADQVDQAIAVCRAEINKFIQAGPSEDELALSKQSIINGFPLRIDSNRDILGYLSVIAYYDLPLTYLHDFREHIAGVTLADIKSAFSALIKPESLVTVVVGRGAQD